MVSSENGWNGRPRTAIVDRTVRVQTTVGDNRHDGLVVDQEHRKAWVKSLFVVRCRPGMTMIGGTCEMKPPNDIHSKIRVM